MPSISPSSERGLGLAMNSLDDAATLVAAAEMSSGGGSVGVGGTVDLAITTVGAGSLTGNGLVGGMITRSGPTAAFTDTTVSASTIISALPDYIPGLTWLVEIRNTTAFPQTIAGGTSVTIQGFSVIPPLSVGIYLITLTAATSLAMAGKQILPLVNLRNILDNTVVTGTGAMVSGAMEGASFVTLTASGQAAITLTTRTAAQIQANVPNFQVGQTYRLRIINNNTGTLTTAGGSNVTMTSTIPAGHYADYTILFATATTITTNQVTVAPTSGISPLGGVAAGYKVARGVHTQVAASDTVVTGLTTVVAVMASWESAPTVKQLFIQASIGDQAGTPAAGSILIKTFKPTAVNDVTPTAATDFTENLKVGWVAIGT